MCLAAKDAKRSERGIALLIVVSLLTVVGIIGVAFVFSMFLETQAGRQFVAANQARYLAEAGISHARALLDEDGWSSRLDDRSEAWAVVPQGSDADVDGDTLLDAVWWPVRDAAGQTAGRYAVRLTDESSKVHLNVAQADGVEGPDMTVVLQAAQVGDPAEAAEAIEAYRYGPDGRPGKADSDDDGDGAIDERDEYEPTGLVGDDRRLENLEELVSVAGLTAEEVKRLSALATVYSWDANVSMQGEARVNVNTASAAELLDVLIAAGVDDPWRTAVNVADAIDADLDLSRVTKSSELVTIAPQGDLGSWVWDTDPAAHYRSAGPGGAELAWAMPAPTGTFQLIARGLAGVKVGDVTVAGELKPSVDDGELLGEFPLAGSVQIQVVNREAAGTPCAFRGIELVSSAPGAAGVLVRGVEAVRFNELMVEPTIELPVAEAVFDPQGSDWGCPVGSPACMNSGVGQARWVWTSTVVPPGRYYVRVLASAAGQTVGEVRIDGNAQLLVHGQRHPSTLLVAADGKISVTIGKTAAQGTYYLQGLTLSVQPDAEYVELINVSDEAINVGGWTIAGELTGGREAQLPPETVIQPQGVLLAAVDLADTQSGLDGNGIDARSAWEISSDVAAVQLVFPGGALSPDEDWLKAAGPNAESRLSLRAGSAVVDEVEYTLAAGAGFQSLEKGDPTVIADEDQDGIDEAWFPSLQLYSPGWPNDNAGMMEEDADGATSTMPNRPLRSVGELAGLPSGTAWKPLAGADLAKMVDRLTVEGYRLETEGHWDGSAAGQGAWSETAEGYTHVDPARSDVAGRWRWPALPAGDYRVSLYGCTGCVGEQVSVRWEQPDQTMTEWSPVLTTDAQGRIAVGQVTIGSSAATEDGLSPWVVEALCASPGGVCHLHHVRLDPRLVQVGAVNVNTAPYAVLQALPGMTDALAARIIAGRPYGNQQQKRRGIGDLLLGSVLGSDEQDIMGHFRELAHWLTVRSEVFEMLSLGQALDGDRPQATQRIRAIVQRD